MDNVSLQAGELLLAAQRHEKAEVKLDYASAAEVIISLNAGIHVWSSDLGTQLSTWKITQRLCLHGNRHSKCMGHDQENSSN